MKINNRKKFIVRTIELIILIVTITLTIFSIKYAIKVRGYIGFGGEYLIPILGVIAILIIEDIYENEENKKEKGKDKNEK